MEPKGSLGTPLLPGRFLGSESLCILLGRFHKQDFFDALGAPLPLWKFLDCKLLTGRSVLVAYIA